LINRILIIRNKATQDVRNQANYILANGNATAAGYYLEMVEQTFEQLINLPGIGKIVRFLPDNQMGEIRQWRVKGFTDYLVFYRVDVDKVEVLRVLYGARDLPDILPQIEDDL
jgi:toxin ParE1/3/4